MQKILDIINAYLRDVKSLDVIATPESRLKEDLHFDSLDAVELLCSINEELKLNLAIEDVISLAPTTVEEVTKSLCL